MRRFQPFPWEGQVPRVPDCFHGLASQSPRASEQQKEMGLAERVLPRVGPGKEAAVAAEPQHTVLGGLPQSSRRESRRDAIPRPPSRAKFKIKTAASGETAPRIPMLFVKRRRRLRSAGMAEATRSACQLRLPELAVAQDFLRSPPCPSPPDPTRMVSPLFLEPLRQEPRVLTVLIHHPNSRHLPRLRATE